MGSVNLELIHSGTTKPKKMDLRILMKRRRRNEDEEDEEDEA